MQVSLIDASVFSVECQQTAEEAGLPLHKPVLGLQE
jgi:hypothetical protein